MFLLDYLSNEEVLKGVRVKIDFGHQKIIGYVIDCQYSKLSKDELDVRLILVQYTLQSSPFFLFYHKIK